MCIVGAALIPVTAGLSGFALIPGAILGGAGGVVSAGAEIGHMIIAKERKDAAEKHLKCEKERLEEIEVLGKEINVKMEQLVAKYPSINAMTIKTYIQMSRKGVFHGSKLIYNGYKVLDAAGDVGRAIFRTYKIVRPFSSALGAVLFAVDIVALPLDVLAMGYSAYKVHRYRTGHIISDKAKKLKEATDRLIDTKSELQEQLKSLDYSDKLHC